MHTTYTHTHTHICTPSLAPRSKAQKSKKQSSLSIKTSGLGVEEPPISGSAKSGKTTDTYGINTHTSSRKNGVTGSGTGSGAGTNINTGTKTGTNIDSASMNSASANTPSAEGAGYSLGSAGGWCLIVVYLSDVGGYDTQSDASFL